MWFSNVTDVVHFARYDAKNEPFHISNVHVKLFEVPEAKKNEYIENIKLSIACVCTTLLLTPEVIPRQCLPVAVVI